MLLSCKWLREFVPFEGTAQQLGDTLTMLGLELEDIVRPYDAIAGIVTGEVLTCVQHPEADKLHVCTVDVGAAGDGTPLSIVCGAPNVAQGQRVAVAMIGATLPGGLTIKKAKLRGQVSCGMLCSERELGLTEDHSGIMVLPPDTPVGRRLVDVLPLDVEVLDISVTPNRADCLSVLGLAREVAMACKLPLSLPPILPGRHAAEQGADASRDVAVDIVNPELCWLYQGKIIENIHVGPSPMHIRHRLHAVGVRPLSNVVDATNYVLMELGQPLHAFDRARIRGNRIVVAPAREGQRFTTLDGQERVLAAGDLCICDGEGPVALAGVMGGLESEITPSSTAVFLESAIFRPATIRKTARRLGLSSEASFRFERGVDPGGCTLAMERAATMIAALAGGTVRPGVCRKEPRPWVAPRMTYRPAAASALLGLDIDEAFATDVLTRLGCTLDKSNAAAWQVTAPSWRYDMSREADLVEEVGRVYGLDKIPPALPPLVRSLEAAGAPPSRHAFWTRIKHWGKGLGLNEAVNYSFVGHKDLDQLNLPREGRISIMNPLSAEQDALRTVLAPGLLQNVRHNIAQGATGVRLFELAHVFAPDPASETTAREFGRLGIILYGNRFDGGWPHGEDDVDYGDIKGMVEHLLTTLHVGAPTCTLDTAHPYLRPAVRVEAQGEFLGHMGRVMPKLADAYHARKDVWLAELDLDALRRLHDKAQPHFAPLPVYPPVRRDITLIAPAGLAVEQVLAYIRGQKVRHLERVVFCNLYAPDGSDERHLTFRLTFRHPERTLQDAEVDKEREKVAQSLESALGVRV